MFQFILNPVSGLDCGGSEIDFDLMWTDETTQRFENLCILSEKKLKSSNVKFSSAFEEAQKVRDEIISIGEQKTA